MYDYLCMQIDEKNKLHSAWSEVGIDTHSTAHALTHPHEHYPSHQLFSGFSEKDMVCNIFIIIIIIIIIYLTYAERA
jgi:hypothetical protein